MPATYASRFVRASNPNKNEIFKNPAWWEVDAILHVCVCVCFFCFFFSVCACVCVCVCVLLLPQILNLLFSWGHKYNFLNIICKLFKMLFSSYICASASKSVGQSVGACRIRPLHLSRRVRSYPLSNTHTKEYPGYDTKLFSMVRLPPRSFGKRRIPLPCYYSHVYCDQEWESSSWVKSNCWIICLLYAN